MSWLMIIAALMPLLEMLLKWINGRTSLTTAQQDRINRIIFKCNQIRNKSCAMGCTPEGSPDAMEASDEIDADKLAGELIDNALADAGYKSAGGADVQEMKSKLSELITKLRNLGLAWDKVFGFVNMIVPMIVAGKVDWPALWAWIQTLLPTPTPGPMS